MIHIPCLVYHEAHSMHESIIGKGRSISLQKIGVLSKSFTVDLVLFILEQCQQT